MIFRIADSAYRTKVLPGNRATDGKKKAGPRKEGRPCVILCWHVRAASRTCRSGYFGGCICIGQVCPGFGIWRNRLDRFDSGRSVCRAGYPKEQKSRLRLRRAAICFCQSLRISAVLFHFLEIDVGHIIVAGRLRLSSAGSRSVCSRSGLGPLRSDPAGRFAARYTYPAKPLAMHC